MIRTRKTSTALLLSMALLLSGCAERQPAPDAETSTASDMSDDSSYSKPISSNSSLEISESSISLESSESTSDPESSSENSSESETEKIPVEFTEEDKEFQKMLLPIAEGCSEISNWFMSAEARDDNGTPIYEGVTFLFPEIVDPSPLDRKVTDTYYRLPNNYLSNEDSLPIPNTAQGIKNSMLEFFTERFINNDNGHLYADKGSMKENEDGTFSVILEDKNAKWCPKFVEIDGIMYRAAGEGGKGIITSILPGSEKIVSKTDDTIEFTFLWGHWTQYDEDGTPLYLDDIDQYNRYANTGVLKYERGGWRRDFDK